MLSFILSIILQTSVDSRRPVPISEMELIPFIERERASIDSAEIFSNTFDFIRDSLHYFQYPPQRDWEAIYDSLTLAVPCTPENNMGLWLYDDSSLCHTYWKLKNEIDNGGRCIYQLRLHMVANKTDEGYEFYIQDDGIPYNIYFFNQRITSLFYSDCYYLESRDESVIANQYEIENNWWLDTFGPRRIRSFRKSTRELWLLKRHYYDFIEMLVQSDMSNIITVVPNGSMLTYRFVTYVKENRLWTYDVKDGTTYGWEEYLKILTDIWK